MTSSDIITTRLHNQHLLGTKLKTPEEVVGWFGAVQSQDFPAAKWGLGIRTRNSTDEQIEQAFNDGKILRTHIMRPTWHFVMPEDIKWMLKLTSPHVKKLLGHYNRKLELTDELFAQTSKIIITALEKNKYLTRQEIKVLLTENIIVTDVQRLAHIVMWAELDGIICSGPRRGKQFTYSLLADRAPYAKTFSREESLATLACRYFESHGPAQLKDFVWWSGLSVKDVQLALYLNKTRLIKETIEEKEYYFSPTTQFRQSATSLAFLLSIFDEYVIAYTDRGMLSLEKVSDKLWSLGNTFTSVVVLNGKVVGSWKRQLKKDSVGITLKLHEKHSTQEMEAIEEATENYRKFLGQSTIS